MYFSYYCIVIILLLFFIVIIVLLLLYRYYFIVIYIFKLLARKLLTLKNAADCRVNLKNLNKSYYIRIYLILIKKSM